MFKNWSKIVLVSMLIVVLGVSFAYGSTARVRSLANTGDYMSDDSNLFRWYSTLPSYANMVQAELGTWYQVYDDGEFVGMSLMDSRALSLNYSCGEDGKWGTYRVSLHEWAVDHPGLYSTTRFMNYFTPGSIDPFWVSNDNVEHPYDETPINRWDMAGGWEIGENAAVGLSFTRSSWSWKDEQTHATADPAVDEEMSSSFTTLGVGGSWSNNEDLVIDGAFTYGFAGGEWTGMGGESDSSLEWDSKSAISVAARAMYDWKDNVTVVPTLEYGTATYALKRSATDYDPRIGSDNTGDKVSGFGAGVGLNMDVNGDNMLIFALEFATLSWEPANTDTTAPDAKTSTLILPSIRLALETEINSWLTTRIGAAHYNIRETDTNGDGKDFQNTNGAYDPDDGMWWSSWFEWTLGCGFNIAEWTVDLELASDAPFSLGYWLTGYTAYSSSSSGGPVGRISGTYNF